MLSQRKSEERQKPRKKQTSKLRRTVLIKHISISFRVPHSRYSQEYPISRLSLHITAHVTLPPRTIHTHTHTQSRRPEVKLSFARLGLFIRQTKIPKKQKLAGRPFPGEISANRTEHKKNNNLKQPHKQTN